MEIAKPTRLSITVNRAEPGSGVAPASARAFLVLAIVGAAAAGFLIGNGEGSAAAVQAAGADLTRLLRAMAGLKALTAAGEVAAIWWRLGAAVPATWLGAYALAAGTMAAGVPLIWGMVHVGAGALALHGGLGASLLLLWRDRAVGRRLAALIAARRARLRA